MPMQTVAQTDQPHPMHREEQVPQEAGCRKRPSPRPSMRNSRPLLYSVPEAELTSRLYDIAERFEVSEAELLATRCDDTAQGCARAAGGRMPGAATVTRLESHWSKLLGELPKLGCVTALTRNRHAVHKKTGTYSNARITGNTTPAGDEEIGLQLFLSHWQSGFAVTEEINVGTHLTVRHSLQFFDHYGTAVHKVFLTEASNHRAYETLVARFTSVDQSPEQKVSQSPTPAPQRRDSAINIKELRTCWQGLRDVRDFDYMLERLGVMPIQALRLAGNDLAWRVAPTGFRQLMEVIVELELPIMLSVGSPGVTQTYTGLIHNLKTVGSWLSVREPGFVLYLREDQIHTAWVVKKPTDSGVVTSLELYDPQGESIAVLSDRRHPGYSHDETEAGVWRSALCTLSSLDPASTL